MGQIQPSGPHLRSCSSKSAYPPITDSIAAAVRISGLCPKRPSARAARSPLLDHLIGARVEDGGHIDAERRGGPEVQHELKRGWLHDGQFVWLRAP